MIWKAYQHKLDILNVVFTHDKKYRNCNFVH